MMLPEVSSVTILRSAAVVAFSAALAVTACAQANSFQLVNKSGRAVGKASYSISKSKDGGQNVKAKFEYRTGVADTTVVTDPGKMTNDGSNITDNQITAEYKVDANGNYLSGFLQNGATQAITSFTPTKPRDGIDISTMQGGVSSTPRNLAMPKKDFLVAPDYDPSAMQVLLTTILNRPHDDHTYLVAVPAVGRGLNQPMYIKAGDPVDATGKLDGKDIKLKKLPIGWVKGQGALYYDEAGNLMQAYIATINITYIRNKFVLDEAR